MQKFMFILPVNLLKFDHQHYFQLSASTFFLLNFSCACASIFKPSVIIIACMPWLYVLTENYIFVVPFFIFTKTFTGGLQEYMLIAVATPIWYWTFCLILPSLPRTRGNPLSISPSSGPVIILSAWSTKMGILLKLYFDPWPHKMIFRYIIYHLCKSNSVN